MTTRTTFEDRLLAELKGEIERRESAPVPAVRRRVLTGRRLTLVMAACVAVVLGVVSVPGTPAGSAAYGLERHGDGSVTLTAKDQEIDVDAQRELARKLVPNGIATDVQILRPGYVCAGDTVLWGQNDRGERVPLFVQQWGRKITLHRGNVLVFVNRNDRDTPYRVYVFPTEADVKPCVPVKPTPERLRA